MRNFLTRYIHVYSFFFHYFSFNIIQNSCAPPTRNVFVEKFSQLSLSLSLYIYIYIYIYIYPHQYKMYLIISSLFLLSSDLAYFKYFTGMEIVWQFPGKLSSILTIFISLLPVPYTHVYYITPKFLGDLSHPRFFFM